ncbi:hypothetical protein PEC18_30815, partial [Paucibacter sp. O1-1]|nr:hypothetical protein [Paucibacter sp. O1-1]MDA3830100.1 hypothetical protein [Paucibacter sp. O1-1]
MGRDIALASLGVFVVAAALASALLMRVMRGLGRDVEGVEAALRSGDAGRASASAARGHFGPALRKFFDTVRHAETEIADLQGPLAAREPAMNATYLRRIYLKLAGVVTLVVLLALLANAALTQRTFEQALAPEVAKKAMSVGASIRALVLKAAENGIGFAELYGVEQRFADVKNEAPEVAYLALTDASGQVLYQHARAPEGAERYFSSPAVLRLLAAPEGNSPPMRLGNQYMVSLPIVGQDGPLGLLHLGVDARFVNDLVLDMLFDVLVVLVVSLFFTLELLHFMAGARLDASLKALGEAFERGASGNFLTRRDRRNELAFGGLLRLMDATLERVNGAYAALGRAVDAGRRVPAHERQPGLAKAQAGLQALGERYRFGTEPPSNRLEEGDLVQDPRAAVHVHPGRGAHAALPAGLCE